MNILYIFIVRASDKRIHCDEEYSDSEDEMGPNESGGRRDRSSNKPKAKRPKTEDEKKTVEVAKGTRENIYIVVEKTLWE